MTDICEYTGYQFSPEETKARESMQDEVVKLREINEILTTALEWYACDQWGTLIATKALREAALIKQRDVLRA
jgi:hypothetical protein